MISPNSEIQSILNCCKYHFIKVYDEARSAHIERVEDGGRDVLLLYRKESYDFEGRGLNLYRRVNLFQIFFIILFGNSKVIEINEPLFVRALPSIVISILAGHFRRILFRSPPKYVTYAIENIDFVSKMSSHARVPQEIIRPFCGIFVRIIVNRLHRIAFGTKSSENLYRSLLGKAALRSELFYALEPVCSFCSMKKEPFSVVFLGAFDERKGIRSLMRAWPAVKSKSPEAQLLILGQGPLRELVLEWGAERPEVRIELAPPRARIHEVLSASKVLVLPSVSSRRWREQIGLPITEGLSHGCAIVTTKETGLADWLDENGHYLIENEKDLPEAICSAFETPYPDSVIQSLPITSGRMQAEAWLWH